MANQLIERHKLRLKRDLQTGVFRNKDRTNHVVNPVFTEPTNNPSTIPVTVGPTKYAYGTGRRNVTK